MKPKLYCTSLFATWEFPEKGSAIKYFPYSWLCPQPRAPVGVQNVPLAKMPHKPEAATIRSCATVVWTYAALSLLADQ